MKKIAPAATAPEIKANCRGCNHPESFHYSVFCKVMACPCKKWNGPKVKRVQK